MTDCVEEHFRLFNQAVRSHDWTAFLETITPDAVMRFNGVAAGPYVGGLRSPRPTPASRPRTR